jgi:hypothetical protein
MGARNRVGIGLSYRPARLHRLRNRFLGSLKFKNAVSGFWIVRVRFSTLDGTSAVLKLFSHFSILAWYLITKYHYYIEQYYTVLWTFFACMSRYKLRGSWNKQEAELQAISSKIFVTRSQQVFSTTSKLRSVS